MQQRWLHFQLALPGMTCCNKLMNPTVALASLIFAGCCLLGTIEAAAQQPPEPVEALARSLLEQETQGLPGAVELEVGTLDPRNRLPPCAVMEAFLPAGVRAWGRVSVGVRCLDPAPWSVFLPSRVIVIDDYLVTARPLQAGQIVGPDDIVRRSGDIAALPARVLLAEEAAIGHHVRFAIATGQPLRSDMLRLPPAVERGQTVKVVGVGERFQVANEGQAMARAAAGENVRVRLANGQVVTGVARTGGIVEVRF